MKVLCQFVNGAQMQIDCGPVVPDIFRWRSKPERISFYFIVTDELPSGQKWAKEISEQSAMRILKERGQVS